MKNLLILLVSLPVLSHAQDSFITGQVGFDSPKNIDLALSARFAGGARIEKDVFLGVGAGVTKFSDNSSLYFPIFGHISFSYNSTAKIFPIIVLQPGYGLYNKTIRVGNEDIQTKGGLTYFAGGVAIQLMIRCRGMSMQDIRVMVLLQVLQNPIQGALL